MKVKKQEEAKNGFFLKNRKKVRCDFHSAFFGKAGVFNSGLTAIAPVQPNCGWGVKCLLFVLEAVWIWPSERERMDFLPRAKEILKK